MKIEPFAVEEWMNAYETQARFNIAETCVDSVSAAELLEICGEDPEAFWKEFSGRRLTYGDIEGAPAFREGVCGLYRTLRPEEVIPTHGAAGANHHVFYSLVEPGDRVISIMPTYQQLVSIPEGYGADLRVMRLLLENGYLPDLEELSRLAAAGTKMICLNNPNNPAGALMSGEYLREAVRIAERAGAWLLCDEVYRHLTQEEEPWCDSVADLYERGISVGSMSKVFSLAGLRLGWIASHGEDLRRKLLSHRDYTHISCGMFDESLAAIALKNRDRLLARSRRIVRENLQLLDAWVQSEPRIRYFKPQAGTTALVFYDYDLPSREFARRLLEETGAFVVPGDCFGEERCMRIGYACDAKTLREGLTAMSAFLRSLETEGRV